MEDITIETQTKKHDQLETDRYKKEYVEDFVEKWDQLIDWDARSDGEGSFFIDLMKERGVQRVLDVATGTGYHSVRLLKAGFDVVSADGSPNMLAKAFENAKRHGYILQTIHADWRWLNRDVHSKYDAIICLGNSFTHLFTERDRRKSLAEFYAALKHDGLLIVDQRNYDALLDQNYSNRGAYYYCGKQVKAEPELVNEKVAKFRYTFPDDSYFHLNMCPIRKDYVRDLMFDVGFQQVKTYADFQETEPKEEPDFFIHCAEKLYGNEYGGSHDD